MTLNIKSNTPTLYVPVLSVYIIPMYTYSFIINCPTKCVADTTKILNEFENNRTTMSCTFLLKLRFSVEAGWQWTYNGPPWCFLYIFDVHLCILFMSSIKNLLSSSQYIIGPWVYYTQGKQCPLFLLQLSSYEAAPFTSAELIQDSLHL